MKNYKDRWDVIQKLASGGQGTTLLARDQNDDSVISVLKILNRQKDMERRARMYRETSALETLSHSNIPKVIDTNTHFWKELDYNLFIALEFIEGITLSDYDLKKDSFETKILFIRKVVEIINYCHQRGVIHRDLKPDNIILRNNSLLDPVVLDFGISFNFTENDDDTLTPIGQHIGNRFLILPEQKIGEAGKRDFRSDITSIIGLLFYVLTGLEPTILADGNENKPHQRDNARILLSVLPKHKYDLLNYIFDVGFNQHIDQRWQTCNALLKQLELLLSIQPIIMNSDKDLLNAIKKKTLSVEYVSKKHRKDIFGELDKRATLICQQLSQVLGEDWGYGQNGFPKDESEYRNMLAPCNFVQKELSLSTVIYAYLTGSEIVVNLYEKENEESMIELCRYPISSIAWEQFETRLKKYYLSRLALG